MEQRIERQSQSSENKDPVISIEELNQIIKILSQNFHVKMSPGEGWAYDFNNNTVYYKKEDLLSRNRKYVLGVLLHENGHIQYTDDSVIEEKYKGNSTFHTLFNCVEDMRIGELLKEEYGGAKEYLQEIYEQDYGPTSEYGARINELPEHLQFGLGMIYEWFYGEQDQYIKSEKIQHLLQTLKPEIEASYQTKSAQKSYEIMRDYIWPHFNKLAEEVKNEAKEASEKELGGRGRYEPWERNEVLKKIVKKKMDEIKKEENAFNQKTRGMAQPTITESGETKDPSVLSILMKDSGGNKKAEKDGEGEVEKVRIKMGFGAGTEKADPNEIKDATYLQYFTPVKPFVNRLTRELKSVLKDNELARYESGYRSGRLAQSQLWRIPLGAEDVFERRRQTGKKNYNFELIVDESDSMHDNEKIHKALQGVVLIQESLYRVVSDPDVSSSISVEVAGFNFDQRVHKKFDQILNNKERQRIVREIINSVGGGTYDGSALDQALKRIINRDGEKMILMLTDGQGAGEPKLVDVLLRVPRNVSVVGIGIGKGTEFVKEVYPRHIFVEDVSQLPAVLVHSIRSRFKRI